MRESGRHCALYIPYKVCIAILEEIIKMMNLVYLAHDSGISSPSIFTSFFDLCSQEISSRILYRIIKLIYVSICSLSFHP